MPDIIYTLATLALIFQTPRVSFNGRSWTFHPAVALSFSLAFLGLYLFVTLYLAFIVYGGETGFENVDQWSFVTWFIVMIQSAVGVCYIGMIVSACVAVHRWRRTKRATGSESFEELADFGNRPRDIKKEQAVVITKE